jgi:hypothetical protein
MPQVVHSRTSVGINGLANCGIEIELICYFDLQAGVEERTVKTALMLEVLRLAHQIGVVIGTGTTAPAAPQARLQYDTANHRIAKLVRRPA